MRKKVRKMLSDRKGFTLVELIVVLVILSVLAAMLAPTMTGYIDKAKEKKVEAKLHQVVVAAQALAEEVYALGGEYADIDLDDIAELAELKEDEDDLIDVIVKGDTGKVVYAELNVNGVDAYYTEEGGIVFEGVDTSGYTGKAYISLADGDGGDGT